MQEARPSGEPLPDWYIAAECMRRYHWTERQFWEENSPGMIARLLFVESVHAERERKEAEKKWPSAPSAPSA